MTNPLRCLITAGPTREHFDPVRFLSNGSSGKMGYALAESAQARGWTVELVSGPVSLPAPTGVRRHDVLSAADMLATCEPLFSRCDIFIAVAAVADFRPKMFCGEKIKRDGQGLIVALEPTVDILKTLVSTKRANQTVVGFAAETRDVEAHAKKKMEAKNLDWIVANDVSRPEIGMNADNNAIVMLSRLGSRHLFGPAPKREVAEFILNTLGLGP